MNPILLSARLSGLLQLKAIDLGREDKYYYGCEASGLSSGEKKKLRFPSLSLYDLDNRLDLPREGTATVKYKVTRRSMNEGEDGKERHSTDIEVHSIDPIEEVKAVKKCEKAKLIPNQIGLSGLHRKLIQLADPRPRNPLGEFSDQQDGPSSDAMDITYRKSGLGKVATEGAVAGASGAAGAGALSLVRKALAARRAA